MCSIFRLCILNKISSLCILKYKKGKKKLKVSKIIKKESEENLAVCEGRSRTCDCCSHSLYPARLFKTQNHHQIHHFHLSSISHALIRNHHHHFQSLHPPLCFDALLFTSPFIFLAFPNIPPARRQLPIAVLLLAVPIGTLFFSAVEPRC